MSATPNNPTRQIKQSDILSSATISGLLTFFLLTLAKEIDSNHWVVPYLTDHTISFVSGVATAAIALGLSFIRFEVNLMVQERDCKRKIYYLDKMISKTSDENTLSELKTLRNKLLLSSAKKVVLEEI
ncbi:hypothetical protein [Halomonas sp. QHL1]|uniref:hypothetical protein n=1 Tax=Halomonas sp. QHL1 TaxID=1123773 RepID=UPI0008FD761A|nr:hypothetical protein [Halomonas sp. QHL1]OJA05153.1 hypothetical protein QHL1GM_06975 [Halomonas sp. QHL1]